MSRCLSFGCQGAVDDMTPRLCIIRGVGGRWYVSSPGLVVVRIMVSLVHRGPFPSMKNDNICHRHLSEQGVGRNGLYTYLASGIATQSGHPSHPSPLLAVMCFHLVLECNPGVDLDPMTTNNELVVVRHHLLPCHCRRCVDCVVVVMGARPPLSFKW